MCDLKVSNGELLPYESENSVQLVGQKGNSSNKKSISNSKETNSTTLTTQKGDSIKTKMEDMHENIENTAQKGGFFQNEVSAFIFGGPF